MGKAFRMAAIIVGLAMAFAGTALAADIKVGDLADLTGATGEVLKEWSSLGYVDLAFEVLSLFIARSVIPEDDLRRLLQTSYSRFEHPDILPVVTLDKKRGIKIMELFHGPTLSFKDIAMVFLINCMDYFLKRSGKHASLLIATTGDIGPAAAYASAGKESIRMLGPLSPGAYNRGAGTADDDPAGRQPGRVPRGG